MNETEIGKKTVRKREKDRERERDINFDAPISSIKTKVICQTHHSITSSTDQTLMCNALNE